MRRGREEGRERKGNVQVVSVNFLLFSAAVSWIGLGTGTLQW